MQCKYRRACDGNEGGLPWRGMGGSGSDRMVTRDALRGWHLSWGLGAEEQPCRWPGDIRAARDCRASGPEDCLHGCAVYQDRGKARKAVSPWGSQWATFPTCLSPKWSWACELTYWHPNNLIYEWNKTDFLNSQNFCVARISWDGWRCSENYNTL